MRYYIVSQPGFSYDEAMSDCEGYVCERHLNTEFDLIASSYGNAETHIVRDEHLSIDRDNCASCCDAYWESYMEVLDQEARWDAESEYRSKLV